MSEVERWLGRQAAREQRGVLLEEALLGGRMWPYTRYRLRFFFAKYLVETAVHAVTVLFLVRDLRWDSFLPIVLVHAGVSLATSFWWGALEAMRGQVRDLQRSGRPHRIARLIGGWLVFAGLASIAVLALGLGWVGWHVARGGLGPAEAYVAALLLRLVIDLPLRCLHSGVYALRRIYKPLPAILGPELLGLALILLLYPVAGLWALVVAALTMTATLSGVTLRYTGRVYRFIGLAPWQELSRHALRGSVRGAARELLQAGSANTVIALDSLVVLALLYGAATDSRALVVLFLAGPTIRAGADWARLFYFDLKRLELRLFTNLRRRFERHTARLAWILGVVFWALAAGLAATFYGWAFPYAALLGFFVARSVLARVQVQAFAEGAYGPVVATGAVLLAGLAAMSALAEGEAARLTAVAIVTAIAAAVLSALRHRVRTRGEPGAALLTLEWLGRLGGTDSPVRVGSAQIVSASGPEHVDAKGREERTRWRLSQLAETTARQLGANGAAAWIGPDRLIWFEHADSTPLLTAEWLQVASGGLVGDIDGRDCANGEEALLAAGQGSLLGPASSHLLAPTVPVDVAAIRRRFSELLPGGAVYAPDEHVPPQLAALPGSELRAILADAVAFARDLRVGRRRSQFDVTALCAGGELRLIFVADRHAGKRARARWHRTVTRHNLHAAVGGARRPAARARLPERLAALRPGRETARVAALRRVPLLSELGTRELERVAAVMTERTFRAGEEVTTEGQPGVGFYVIEDGQASVAVGGAEVGRLGPGDHFGEIALVAETPRMATITATTDLRCYRMVSWEFRRLIEDNASISWQVLRSTAKLLDEARRAREVHAQHEPRVRA